MVILICTSITFTYLQPAVINYVVNSAKKSQELRTSTHAVMPSQQIVNYDFWQGHEPVILY
jgi:hypothetical protein